MGGSDNSDAESCSKDPAEVGIRLVVFRSNPGCQASKKSFRFLAKHANVHDDNLWLEHPEVPLLFCLHVHAAGCIILTQSLQIVALLQI